MKHLLNSESWHVLLSLALNVNINLLDIMPLCLNFGFTAARLSLFLLDRYGKLRVWYSILKYNFHELHVPFHQKRNQLMMDMTKDMVSSAIVEGNTTIKSKRQLSQIIDTTLLKCYIQVKHPLQKCLVECCRPRIPLYVISCIIKEKIHILQ